eukprot:INCI13441.2.p1 GENE.INCI13441.2~~INCI13441.2.p1  ORF type:complete len:358 (+),score=63.36 INCI13441.2:123-1196(+)
MLPLAKRVIALALLSCSSLVAPVVADVTKSCPSLEASINSTFTLEGQWCASQQLLLAPDGTAVGELDYVYISNKKNFIVGGNWFLHLPRDSNGNLGAVVSRTQQSNVDNSSLIVEDVLDCNNRTVVNVEIDNSAGISFSNGAATTFWVFNSTTSPPTFLLKLLATRSSSIQSNEIVAYACPPHATSKDACGGPANGHDGLGVVATMTTPWLNLVVQHWTFQYNTSATAVDRALLPISLAAQIIGLATSPQSLSWCASSIAVIVIVPLIIALVSCCCCHRRRCCKCGRSAASDPYQKTLSEETERQQYDEMFAVPHKHRSAHTTVSVALAEQAMDDSSAGLLPQKPSSATTFGEYKKD